jgi:hypothetical protein
VWQGTEFRTLNERPSCLAMAQGIPWPGSIPYCSRLMLAHMGYTPLHSAAFARHPEAARALLREGADVNVQAPGGPTPLSVAVLVEDYECVRVLLSEGADIHRPDRRAALGRVFELHTTYGSLSEVRAAARRGVFRWDDSFSRIVRLLLAHEAKAPPR